MARTQILAALAFSLLTTLVAGLAIASAQESSGVTPLYGDGTLAIVGNGFAPGERVEITVTIHPRDQRPATHALAATADAGGSFRVSTGIAVPPGSSVELHARGSQGSGGAAITAPPVLSPGSSTTGDRASDGAAATTLPRTGDPGTLAIIALAVSVLAAGVAIRGYAR